MSQKTKRKRVAAGILVGNSVKAIKGLTTIIYNPNNYVITNRISHPNLGTTVI